MNPDRFILRRQTADKPPQEKVYNLTVKDLIKKYHFKDARQVDYANRTFSLPCKKVGHKRYFNEEDVLSWRENNAHYLNKSNSRRPRRMAKQKQVKPQQPPVTYKSTKRSISWDELDGKTITIRMERQSLSER